MMSSGVCAESTESELTDGVSGPGGFGGNGERTESKSVFSSDPEQVVLTFKQAWHHVSLAGTGCIHLNNSINPSVIQSEKTCIIS